MVTCIMMTGSDPRMAHWTSVATAGGVQGSPGATGVSADVSHSVPQLMHLVNAFPSLFAHFMSEKTTVAALPWKINRNVRAARMLHLSSESLPSPQ